MPIILAGSKSHTFSYTDEHGIEREATVYQGQSIDGLGLSPEMLQKLMLQRVVTPNGRDRRPRYVQVTAPVSEEPSARYSEGPTTVRRVKPEPVKQESAAEIQKKLMAAAEEVAAEEAAKADAQAAAAAAMSGASDEVAAENARVELLEQAKSLGLKPHHKLGAEKLQNMIDLHHESLR